MTYLLPYWLFYIFDPLSASIFVPFESLGGPWDPEMKANMHILYYFTYLATSLTIW